MKLSKVTAELLDYIQKGVSSSPHTVVRTVNALGSGPLAYRTFGGNVQNYAAIDEQALEKAFGSHYLLTMIAQGLIIRRILYPESGSCHTLIAIRRYMAFSPGTGCWTAAFGAMSITKRLKGILRRKIPITAYIIRIPNRMHC